jgi:MFS family permease
MPDIHGGTPRSGVRYGVLIFVCALSMITYLDRACIAAAATYIQKALGLRSRGEMGNVFAAFSLAYALFEVPTGWLGDVFGPKKVLIRIVLWWSAFTALTGLAGMSIGGATVGLTALVVIRFLFGMGEAGAYPNITRALHNWFPVAERGRAQGAVWMSGRILGGLTFVIFGILISGIGAWDIQPILTWRQAFWSFGVVGVVWCVLFAWWFRNRPEQKASVNEAELAWIRSSAAETQASRPRVPWAKILASPNLWLVCAMYLCLAYGWYFNITYLPLFFEDRFFSGDQLDAPTRSLLINFYKGGPLLLGAVGCLVGGLLTDRYVRRTGDRRWGRRLFGLVGLLMASLVYVICYYASPHITTPLAFGMLLAMAGFFADLTMSSAWSVCQDIGQRYAAIVAGFMNMVGNLGGTVASLITGRILGHSLNSYAAGLGMPVDALTPAQKAAGNIGGYETSFLVFAAVFALGAVCWLFIDASRPVVRE